MYYGLMVDAVVSLLSPEGFEAFHATMVKINEI
jgi:hypothetical protein